MRLLVMVVLLSSIGCIKKEEKAKVTMAQLTCYSGENIFYQVTTQPYKIHKPSEDDDDITWEIDTDQGKVIITGTCIYKSIDS